MNRVPLDLFAEVTTASGTRYKWDANQAPGSRLANASFRTKIGEGFSDGAGMLSRRIDLDYPDLNLADMITFTGADGSIAYEGRLSAMPRDLTDKHSVGVQLAGLMACAKDRKFQEIYVDREAGNWEEYDLARKIALAGTYDLTKFSATAGNGGLSWDVAVEALPNNSIHEMYYTPPAGLTVSRIMYRGARTGTFTGFEAPFAITGAATALTLDDTLRSASLTPGSSVFLRLYLSGGAFTPATPLQQRYTKIAVYGSSGITTRVGDTAEPDGVYASDVIRDIAQRFCPSLDTSGVQDTSYVIQHLAFRDRTFPYDAFLEVNKYHLWHLGVWDNRQLVFKPYDLTDYDWEIRTDDPGTTFSPQGPSTDSLFNGIAVTYTDALTGISTTLTPETNPTELSDTSAANPWNAHGTQHWDEITLSTPTLAAIALELGRAALADRNRPKTPGTITVRGYVRDRAGNPQPCWKVRAGDTIAITNFPNDTPRLIVETDYDDEGKQVRIAVDKPFALLDAYLDRQANALQAAGLR